MIVTSATVIAITDRDHQRRLLHVCRRRQMFIC